MTEQKKAPKHSRWGKFAVIGAYLIGLAFVPQLTSLGFRPAPPTAEAAELDGDEQGAYETVSWDLLGSFPYDFEVAGEIDDTSPEALAARNERLFPPAVRALDRRPIAIRGYAIPIDYEQGGITALILAARNELGCCFGDGLMMNQWIHVSVPSGAPIDLEPFELTTVLGRLEVGEEVQNGVVFSLYRIREATVRR